MTSNSSFPEAHPQPGLAAQGGADAPLTRHLNITGRVQGVGYRWAMAQQAEDLGLSGWVRNRHDGSVEAVLCGPPAAVQALIDWAHHGPPLARVQAVRVTELDTEAPGVLRAFVQRETV
jgi:acylphosphatase